MNKPIQTQEQETDRTARFGEEGIMKLLIQYSLPSIVAMLVQSTYNTINMSFVGRSVGPLGIAAIAVCMPIMMIQYSVISLISSGCSAAVAIKLGQGDKESGRAMLGSSVAFNQIFAAAGAILGLMFIEPILRAFGASETILPLAKDYMTITLAGSFIGTFGSLNPMLRIEGYPRRAMMTMLFSTLVNLICSPTFIFVFGWGIRGAALGTVCAQLGTSGWIFLFLINKDRVIGLKKKHFRLKLNHLSYVIQLGLPNFLMSLSQSLLSVTLNRNLVAYGGDIAMSAWGITNNIDTLISQPVFGFNQGAQPIIGYNIGAKNYARVKLALYCSLGTAMFFSTIGWLLTRVFPAQIFAFFNNDPELIAMGVRMMKIFRAFLFVVGFQQMGSAYFQFSGKPKISIILTLSRQVLILLPCIVVMSRLFGFDGILYSGPIADFSSMVLTAFFVVKEIKRLDKLHAEHEEELRLAAESGVLPAATV